MNSKEPTQPPTLRLSLKRRWFDLIASGAKKEEYRDMKPFWTRRLMQDDGVTPRHYARVEFTLGYPKRDDASRRMTFEVEGIQAREGRPDWGATPGVDYYVIILGRRIDAP